MPAPYPQFLPEAFAISANPAYRNTIPAAPVTTQRASFDLGFPPLTMTPIVAGGKPMLGPDMNGILYMLSTHTIYQQSGKLYIFDAAVAAAIGGYAVGTMLASSDGTIIWYCVTANNSGDPNAGGAGWVAMYSYGLTAIAGLIGGVRVLTAVEAARPVIVLSGALVANQQIVLPNQYRRWLIVNTTTGGFTTTVKTAAGLGVIIPQGGFNAPVEVWSNTASIYNVVAPVNLPIDQNPTFLTIVQRTNAGYVLATYFNQSSGNENFAMSAIFAEAASDGYHRKISPANFQAQLNVGAFGGAVTDGQVPQSAVTQHGAAILANAALTDVPTTPTAAPGTNNAQVASTGYVDATALGNGQNWIDVSGVRAFNTDYQNVTGRSIQWSVCVSLPNFTSAQVVIGGQQVANNSAGASAEVLQASPVVPAGAIYRVNTSGAVLLDAWSELA